MERFAKWVKWSFLGILISFVLFYIGRFIFSNNQQLINIFDDDAYYYFKIARNFSQWGRLTFDGQTLTNGFQPLWLLVLIPFFSTIHDPIIVLRFVGVFSVLLTGMAGYLGIRYLNRYSLLPFSLGAAILLFCIFSFGVTGMETAVLLPLLVGSLLLIRWLKPWQPTPPSLLLSFALTVSLSLLLLARLDTIWLIGVLLASLILFFSPSKFKAFLLIASGPLLTLILYLSFNYIVFGNLMPTSGTAKSLSHSLLYFNSLFLSQLTMKNRSFGNLWGGFAASFVFAVVYLLFFGISRIKRLSISSINESYIPLCVASSFIIFTAYELFRSTWVLWRWYGYPLVPMGIFVFPHIIDLIHKRLSRVPSLSRGLNYSALIFSIITCFQMIFTSMRSGIWSISIEPGFQFDNYSLAQSLNRYLPVSTTIAMGDRAGSFGYFFHGKVLQLEGLVGDERLLQAIKSNSLMNYMTQFGVDYVIAYWDQPQGNYSIWTLVTPLPGYSLGPHAGIVLCQETEVLSFGTSFETIHMWKWPSCSP